MSKNILIPAETIQSKILWIRNQKVMIGRDLADLYGVGTKVLNQAVKRNRERFPEDFMFQLSHEELNNWRSQFVTSKKDKKGLRYKPFVFTENGVAMLSSVLNSRRAIQVNIQIMRTFTKLRKLMIEHRDLREKIETMEKKYDYQFQAVFDAIKNLLAPPAKPKNPIGFHVR